MESWDLISLQSDSSGLTIVKELELTSQKTARCTVSTTTDK